MPAKEIFTVTVTVNEHAQVGARIEMLGTNDLSDRRVANALEMIVNGLREPEDTNQTEQQTAQ